MQRVEIVPLHFSPGDKSETPISKETKKRDRMKITHFRMFLIVLEAGRSKIKALADLVPGEGLLFAL